MTREEYIRRSLELHLFFDRIMKEHSFFLEAAFLKPQEDLKKTAHNFQMFFSDTLDEVIKLANNNVSKEFLDNNEILTKDTLTAEKISSELSGIEIKFNITEKELNLMSGGINTSDEMINCISKINQRTLPVIEKLVQFKNYILNQVLSCKMYTANYPLLITHIMNEAKMFHNLLTKIEKKEAFTEQYIYEQEVFWNTIMKEHAEFIRGLLDPSEKELILTADKYAGEYNSIIRKYSSNPYYLKEASLKETLDFKKFKVAGVEGLLTCKIKSIIVPLLADHVLREANHFIRILRSGDKKQKLNVY